MPQDTLFVEQMEQTLSILTNRYRLKLVGLLSFQAYSLEELASLLNIRVALVARHLRKLQRLGLVDTQPEKTAFVTRYTLNTDSFRLLAASWHTSFAAQEALAGDEITCDENIFAAWECDIIRRYFAGSRLTTIPAARKHLAVIVKWFAQLFEVGVCYREKEVNEIIQLHYSDYAFFKKDLVGRGYLRRDHDTFWRIERCW